MCDKVSALSFSSKHMASVSLPKSPRIYVGNMCSKISVYVPATCTTLLRACTCYMYILQVHVHAFNIPSKMRSIGIPRLSFMAMVSFVSLGSGRNFTCESDRSWLVWEDMYSTLTIPLDWRVTYILDIHTAFIFLDSLFALFFFFTLSRAVPSRQRAKQNLISTIKRNIPLYLTYTTCK